MTTTFNITLGLDNGTQMNLTADGFRNLNYDAQTFDMEAKAQVAFNDIDAQSLIQDGFKGYHNVTVWLSSSTLEADDEVSYKILAEKKIVVDTMVAA